MEKNHNKALKKLPMVFLGCPKPWSTEAVGGKRDTTHLKVVIQLQRLEVLELPQIPELDGGVVGGRGQVVPILREGDAGDGPGVSREVGHVGAFLGTRGSEGTSALGCDIVPKGPLGSRCHQRLLCSWNLGIFGGTSKIIPQSPAP